jgi:osmotically inducible protein OsmC
MARTATAEWKGTLKEGAGTMSLGSGAFTGNYTFKSRFEEGEGTNPEELIGAAEAGCFTMGLSNALAEAGYPVDSVNTEAKVSIRNIDGLPTIASIAITTVGRVPGVDEATFVELANTIKDQCIISRALAGVGDITVDAKLES